MLRLLPKTFAAMAVLGSSLLLAQADLPPAPANDDRAAEAATEAADAAADTTKDAAADAAAGAAVETPATDGKAGVEADAATDADVPAAPAPGADIDANAEVRPNADARVKGNGPGGAGTDADIKSRGQARSNDGRATGRAKVQSRTGADARIDYSRRPALGVSFRNQGDALVISRVYPNSPAARMGLRTGDRIVRFNGQDYTETQVFVDAAGQVSLDDDAEIVYFRDGQNYTGNVWFMPWTQVFVDDDGEIETQRRVLRPGIGDADDADDAIEEAIEDGRVTPAQPAPQIIPNEAVDGKVEIDDGGVEIDND